MSNMVRVLQDGDVDAMLEHLKTFFANVTNTITLQSEKYYQTIFFKVGGQGLALSASNRRR